MTHHVLNRRLPALAVFFALVVWLAPLANAEELRSLTGHVGVVWTVAYSPDCRHAADV